MTNQHTPGPWKLDGSDILGSDVRHTNGRLRNALGISSASYSENVCHVHGSIELATPQANARLIAEAGTVATETGLTPRQLAEQRAELLEALKILADRIDEGLHGKTEVLFAHGGDPGLLMLARAAIARATGGA